MGPALNAYWSLFFIMTGIHGLHVALGLVAMIFLLGRMKGKAGDPGETNVFQAVGYYWHFVDFMWIGIFSCLFLLKTRLSARDCEDMRTKLRARHLLPGFLVAGVAVVGLLIGRVRSQAATPPATAPTSSTATAPRRRSPPRWR